LFKLLLTLVIVFTNTIFVYSNHHTNTKNNVVFLKKQHFALNKKHYDDTIKPVGDTVRFADDSIKFAGDTIKKVPKVDSVSYKKSDMAFDYPVYYDAEDSLLFDFQKKKAYLYGKAVVTYESVVLNSAFIEMDFDNNEVFAFGLTDSTGALTGKPSFKDGEEEFEADTIRYNFRTKKGIIKEVMTEFEGSYLHGSKTKMQPNKDVHMINGKFTTCDLDHPHYYFSISKAKVIPNDKIVSGPAYLVIEDIPTPLGIPFGFFPNTKGGSSGLILPEFGSEDSRGYFLKNGGYYWAINDNIDLTVIGDIFSKGSWGMGILTNYKVRYKYSGSVSFKYGSNKYGYRNINQQKESNYSLQWKYTQDPKMRPNSTFSANVNISSSKFDRYNNSYNIGNALTTNKQSSIAYSKVFANSPFSITGAIRHNQNNSTGAINLTLPDISFNMSRIYPFKRKVKVGESKIYEKIGVSYTMNLTNQISTSDSTFFDIGFNNITNGISHKIPISTSAKFLKFTTITPSFNYTERWYLKSFQQSWGYATAEDTVETLNSQYISQFSRAWDYNTGVNWSTQIYGTFNFKKGSLKAIRHVVTPSVSFSYLPDFGKEKYGYYDDYSRIQYNSNTGQYDTVSTIYSRFTGLPYGSPSRGGAGSLNFNIGNNLEMKLRNKGDTVTTDKKIKLLESLSFSTSYNIMADSLNWAPVAVSGRTKIKFLDLSFNANLDPYAYAISPYDSTKAYRINTTSFSENGKLVRLTTANITAGFSLNSKSFQSPENNSNASAYETLYGNPAMYVDFNVPWNVRVNYSLGYAKPYMTSTIRQTLNVSGDFNLTKKWKISFTSGYDLVKKAATPTSIDVYRDLHCWEASLHLVPFGTYRSYMFQINVKASMLKDLKLVKRGSFYDNLFNGY